MLLFEPYLDQLAHWPKTGRHILAQFDSESIIVYQAYQPTIAQYALEHCYFGGGFSYERMSWIKTNFLWMMYRSSWGTKPGQESVLAIRLKRSFFDSLLAQAVESSYNASHFTTPQDWKHALARSSIRMQWDPDHLPTGGSLERRALQLGLRGRILKDYGRHQILEISDLSSLVAKQRGNISSENRSQLVTPLERVYKPDDPAIKSRLILDDFPSFE